jgi:NAD-specific glutamate dehydrogenase
MVHDAIIKVLASEMGIAGSGEDFEYLVFNSENRDVKGSTSQVIDKYFGFSIALVFDAIGEGGGGGLVDDTNDIETGDRACVFRRLSLGIVEVLGM